MNPATILELKNAAAWAKRLQGTTYSDARCYLPGGRADAALRIPAADAAGAAIEQAINHVTKADPAQVKAAQDLYRRLCQGDREAMESVNRARIELTNNFVAPMAQFASGFFNTVTLADDEYPIIQNETGNEVTFTQISENGEPVLMRLNPSACNTRVSLYVQWSDGVTYPLQDLYLGTGVAEPLLRTIDLARDLALNMDAKALTLLDSNFGNFTTSGAKKSRTYVPHSAVKTANLPTSNDITVDGATTTTDFSTQVFKEALGYCDSWGNLLGGLRPTGIIYVPASDTRGLLDQIPVTGSQSNSVADGILQNYTRVNFGGVTWTLVPSVLIDPNRCYVQLTKPVGTLYLKPGLNQVIDTAATEEARRKNLAKRQQSLVYGMAIPAVNKPNALRIRYRIDA